jgi:hypothetical protein
MADGGIGEAALLSAAIGGGTSLVTGGDPLRGALMGGLTGGAMAGLSGAGSLAAAPESASAVSQAAGNAIGATEGLAYQPGAGYGAGLSNTGASALDTQAFMEPGINAGTSRVVPNAPIPTSPVSPNVFGYSPLTNTQLGMIGAGTGISGLMEAERKRYGIPTQKPYTGILSKYDPYTAGKFTPFAEGGIAGLSANPNFPMSQQQNPRYAVPSQMPVGAEQIRAGAMPPVPMARGGISDLGSYSDGGRMLKGPGDGMSDDIPASISGKQPARLADGEFVVPADVVSHLGNGSTDAGAKQLYSMMDKVRKARTGKVAQGKQINPKKYVPA